MPIDALPEALLERARLVSSVAPRPNAELVLYWMRTAVRGHENPALDVALTLANERGLPVLVYQGLSARYPYASDRHHTFILEGARDVAHELAARGIAYAFYLERSRADFDLCALARRAALVVTEDLPIDPLRAWTEAVASESCVVAVDTACIVPMKLVGRAYDRAFAFEKATKKLRQARIARTWQEVTPQVPRARFELPFEPVDLATANLAELVASCPIDHGVGPVHETRGGSVAGYARFAAFREGALRRYARERNDPLAGVSSRMSAYLHYGHVSPFRVAREAFALGAEKYLDELLTWRELPYAFTAYTRDYETVAALPAWARETLARHAGDPRKGHPSWETLARGRTGDLLWDAAQAHLLRHGELHNNVRMTWGKALLEWTRSPAEALALLVDLNHRYALDGRDPASYGGLLWCLGQFDRPFTPETPILGSVRPRPTEVHARRLDIPAYSAMTRRASGKTLDVVVVGGGLSGLLCARTLHDHGHSVLVVDKGNDVGGRASSRRAGELVFDHGASSFRAESDWLRRHVTSWERDGVVARWSPRTRLDRVQEWVGTPTMGTLAAHLAKDLDVHRASTVSSVRFDGRWSVTMSSHEDSLEADVLVLALPFAQTSALLEGVPFDPGPEPGWTAAPPVVTPCWAVMLAVMGGPDADLLDDELLTSAVRETSKPGRRSSPGLDTWTLQLTAEASAARLERDPALVRDEVATRFVARHAPGATVVEAVAHRWRYARSTSQVRAACHVGRRLVLCGDWLTRSTIEGAFESGLAAAGRVLEMATTRPITRSDETRSATPRAGA